jgi:uncharacterized protein YfcZ (UPF0381/DUF406 family)
MKQIEDKAFADLCKNLGIKNITDFEKSQGNSQFFDKKCELEQLISKLENESKIVESNLNLQ